MLLFLVLIWWPCYVPPACYILFYFIIPFCTFFHPVRALNPLPQRGNPFPGTNMAMAASSVAHAGLVPLTCWWTLHRLPALVQWRTTWRVVGDVTGHVSASRRRMSDPAARAYKFSVHSCKVVYIHTRHTPSHKQVLLACWPDGHLFVFQLFKPLQVIFICMGDTLHPSIHVLNLIDPLFDPTGKVFP